MTASEIKKLLDKARIEKTALDVKLNKLDSYIENDKLYQSLGSVAVSLLFEQRGVMGNYSKVLEQRIVNMETNMSDYDGTHLDGPMYEPVQYDGTSDIIDEGQRERDMETPPEDDTPQEHVSKWSSKPWSPEDN